MPGGSYPLLSTLLGVYSLRGALRLIILARDVAQLVEQRKPGKYLKSPTRDLVRESESEYQV